MFRHHGGWVNFTFVVLNVQCQPRASIIVVLRRKHTKEPLHRPLNSQKVLYLRVHSNGCKGIRGISERQEVIRELREFSMYPFTAVSPVRRWRPGNPVLAHSPAQTLEGE